MFPKEQQNKYLALVKGQEFCETKILIVGAGGLGCELIKNLCKWNFKITIMDYDSIS